MTPRLKLAVAESMTCGQLQAQIGAISGASKFFLGGITAYTLDEKVRHLGVNRAAAKRADCVSERVAAEMARGACRLFGADIAVSTTGYAESVRRSGGRAVGGSGSPKVPFVYWGLSHGRTLLTGLLEFPGCSRVEAQTRAAASVLKILADYLAKLRTARRPDRRTARPRLRARSA